MIFKSYRYNGMGGESLGNFKFNSLDEFLKIDAIKYVSCENIIKLKTKENKCLVYEIQYNMFGELDEFCSGELLIKNKEDKKIVNEIEICFRAENKILEMNKYKIMFNKYLRFLKNLMNDEKENIEFRKSLGIEEKIAVEIFKNFDIGEKWN